MCLSTYQVGHYISVIVMPHLLRNVKCQIRQQHTKKIQHSTESNNNAKNSPVYLNIHHIRSRLYVTGKDLKERPGHEQNNMLAILEVKSKSIFAVSACDSYNHGFLL